MSPHPRDPGRRRDSDSSRSRRSWSHRWAATLTTAALMAVSGCTSSVPDATGLGGADVALYVTEFTNRRTSDGRVLLYDRQGPVSQVAVTGVMNPGLVWDESGLFFIDSQADYQVSDRVERRVRSREAGLLAGMRGGRDGRRVVLFDDGVHDGRNHTGIGIYNGAREVSRQLLLDGDGMGLASCEHGLFVAGRAAREVGESSELVRLDPPGGGPPQRVGDPVPGTFLDGLDTPCRDDRVYGLWRPPGTGSSTTLEVWAWNTRDGSVRRTPLRDDTGTFSLSDDAVAGPSTLPRWLDGDDLVWVDNTGTGWRTDLATGRTTRIREGLICTGAPITNWARTGNWLVGFEYLGGYENAHLQIYSASDLSLVETRELPRLAELTPHDRMVLAIAVGPTFRPRT